MQYSQSAKNRRAWPILLVIAIVCLAAGWTGVWFYAAGRAQAALVDWRAREAKSGRQYSCETESFGGFPFRIEVECAKPVAELRAGGTRLLFAGTHLIVVAQVYQPTLLISEFASPVTVSKPGGSPIYLATWSLGQASLRGTPRAPQRVSLSFDRLKVERAGTADPVFGGEHVELHGRLAEGTVDANPILDLAVRAREATAPGLHPIAAAPFQLEAAARLRGLADLRPKPWPDRFRELYERGGRIEVTSARLQQANVLAVTSGSLGLTADGNLDGQLQMTVVGLEHILKQLDLETIFSQGRIGSTIDKLDRLLPGLGAITRKSAAPGILAGLDAIGTRTTLEGKPALSVPLRIVDGRVMLGPIPIGRTPPLF